MSTLDLPPCHVMPSTLPGNPFIYELAIIYNHILSSPAVIVWSTITCKVMKKNLSLILHPSPSSPGDLCGISPHLLTYQLPPISTQWWLKNVRNNYVITNDIIIGRSLLLDHSKVRLLLLLPLLLLWTTLGSPLIFTPPPHPPSSNHRRMPLVVNGTAPLNGSPLKDME